MPASARSNSVRGSLGSSVRRASASQALGLEHEMMFGSEEDLMETIGEIEVPKSEGPDLPPLPGTFPPLSAAALHPNSPGTASSASSVHSVLSPHTAHKMRKTSSTKSSFSLRVKEPKDTPRAKDLYIGSTSHLISVPPPMPPVPPPAFNLAHADLSVLGDKPGQKRGSLMGAFKGKGKGLRSKWKEEHGKPPAGSATATPRSTLLPARPSASHSPATSLAPPPHLGPINLSPTSTSLWESEATPRLGFPRSATVIIERDEGELDSFSTSTHQSSSGRHDIKRSIDTTHSSKTKSSSTSHTHLTSSSHLTHLTSSSHLTQLTSCSAGTGRESFCPGDISPAILPGFPATIVGLEPITVLTTSALKRQSSSILSSARWTSCMLVFTLFKVAVTGSERDDSGDEIDERTVAHLHMFSSPERGAQPVSRTEVERQPLCRQSTASVCGEFNDADGGRAVVLSVVFGDENPTKPNNEWILEMKNSLVLQEWIRHIKKTAIMINAEELGYGPAIRQAYENKSVSADDLAHKLSVHARAVNEAKRRAGGDLASSTSRRMAKHAAAIDSPTLASPRSERRNSLDGPQGAALSRSRSADDVSKRVSDLARSHRKSSADDAAEDAAASASAGAGANRLAPSPPPRGSSTSSPSLGPPVLPALGAPIIPALGAPIMPALGSPISALGPPISSMPAHSGLGSLMHQPAAESISLTGPALTFPCPPSDLPSPRSPRSLRGGPLPPPRSPRSPRMADEVGRSLRATVVAARAIGTAVPTLALNPFEDALREHAPGIPQMHTPDDDDEEQDGDDNDDNDDEEEELAPPPPTPPLSKSASSTPPVSGDRELMRDPHAEHRESLQAPSITSTANGSTDSSTCRLRRLRGKPQVIDIMNEFSQFEADNMPPEEDEVLEPIPRDDRERRRIRFA